MTETIEMVVSDNLSLMKSIELNEQKNLGLSYEVQSSKRFTL